MFLSPNLDIWVPVPLNAGGFDAFILNFGGIGACVSKIWAVLVPLSQTWGVSMHFAWSGEICKECSAASSPNLGRFSAFQPKLRTFWCFSFGLVEIHSTATKNWGHFGTCDPNVGQFGALPPHLLTFVATLSSFQPKFWNILVPPVQI